jgi:hypothetical protein
VPAQILWVAALERAPERESRLQRRQRLLVDVEANLYQFQALFGEQRAEVRIAQPVGVGVWIARERLPGPGS